MTAFRMRSPKGRGSLDFDKVPKPIVYREKYAAVVGPKALGCSAVVEAAVKRPFFANRLHVVPLERIGTIPAQAPWNKTLAAGAVRPIFNPRCRT